MLDRTSFHGVRKLYPTKGAPTHSLAPFPAKECVKGVGPWTIGQFFISIGRTDVLMADCYEVKRGLKHLLASQGAADVTVKAARGSSWRSSWSHRASRTFGPLEGPLKLVVT